MCVVVWLWLCMGYVGGVIGCVCLFHYITIVYITIICVCICVCIDVGVICICALCHYLTNIVDITIIDHIVIITCACACVCMVTFTAVWFSLVVVIYLLVQWPNMSILRVDELAWLFLVHLYALVHVHMCMCMCMCMCVCMCMCMCMCMCV